jgi:hypothetical protein
METINRLWNVSHDYQLFTMMKHVSWQRSTPLLCDNKLHKYNRLRDGG